MGWAQRERRAREQLEPRSYHVRRWTAFEWPWPKGKGVAKQRASLLKDREGHLERAAAIMERKLLAVCPRLDPGVKAVRVGGEPQLLFSFTVVAADEEDAKRSALYKIARALSAKLPTGQRVPVRDHRGRPLPSGATRVEQVALTPPWGRWEVEPVS